jgi:8-oxo-dGTP pyrophosphatase MutT (NUDIX family)
MAGVHRRAARVLVIDEQERVLLLLGHDPARPRFGIWHTPGGGIQDGESASDAARRELVEEVGLRCGDLGNVVWTRRLDFSFDGVRYDQDEVFFVQRVESHEVVTDGRSESEGQYLSDHRWFSVDDLRAAHELVAPPDLPDRLVELLTLGPPPRPVEVRGAVLP